MTRIRHSASTRPRARLISTPHTTYEGIDHVTSTVEGVKFSDNLAALLDHAIANGFRIEQDTRSRAKGVVIYAPDKTVPPISVQERGAKFNKAHYDNIRRELYRAGCPPMPADVKHDETTDADTDTRPTTTATAPEETPMTSRSRTSKAATNKIKTAALDADLKGPDRAELLAGIVAGLFEHADLEVFGDLAAGMIYSTAKWAEETKEALADAAIGVATAQMQSEVTEALRLAADNEATAGRLQAALDKAEEREKKAREDCAAALRRAEAAEAQARELDAAIAPLRALLGKAS